MWALDKVSFTVYTLLFVSVGAYLEQSLKKRRKRSVILLLEFISSQDSPPPSYTPSPYPPQTPPRPNFLNVLVTSADKDCLEKNEYNWKKADIRQLDFDITQKNSMNRMFLAAEKFS